MGSHQQVKRTKPKTFDAKYCGSAACLALTLKPVLSDEQGMGALGHAMWELKKSKTPERKVTLTISTVGIRITDAQHGETIENEPLIQIAYFCAVPKEKKKVAYITSYSKLGLVYAHVFTCAKTSDAEGILEAIADRKRMASESKSMVPPTGVLDLSYFMFAVRVLISCTKRVSLAVFRACG